MSQDLGRDVPDLDTFYARKLWADFSFPTIRQETNPNFLVQISSDGVGVFHVKGWGPKSSVCPSKPRETKLFGGIQARKGTININVLVRLRLGRPPVCPWDDPRFVPGTNPGCPRDKPRFSPYVTQWKPSLSLGQTRFVPGTNPVCPWDKPVANGGRESLCAKCLCAFSLGIFAGILPGYPGGAPKSLRRKGLCPRSLY